MQRTVSYANFIQFVNFKNFNFIYSNEQNYEDIINIYKISLLFLNFLAETLTEPSSWPPLKMM